MNQSVLRELDLAVLKKDLPQHGLVAGDVGTVVFVLGDHEAYKVEFVRADGLTIALETLRRTGRAGTRQTDPARAGAGRGMRWPDPMVPSTGNIKPLPPADRLRVATLMLEGIPPESVVDENEEWSDEDLRDLSRASLSRAVEALGEEAEDA